MGETTKIGYCDATWSPFIGCDQRNDPGCVNCYAKAWAQRTERFRGHWGPKARRYFFSSRHWHLPWAWNRNAQHDGRPRLVLPSLCDPFEELPNDHPDCQAQAGAQMRFWQLIKETPWLIWLVLTKRPENFDCCPYLDVGGELLQNMWLGVTVVNQQQADERIPLLLEARAALRWVSIEPMLGPIELDLGCPGCNGRDMPPHGQPCGYHGGIDWVVVSCESRGARPGRHCDPAWAQSIVDQCAAADVPCFAKQLELKTWPGRLVKSPELAAYGWPVQLPELVR